MNEPDWTTFDGPVKAAWEAHVAKRLAVVLGRSFTVHLMLPGVENARQAWTTNSTLRGSVRLVDDMTGRLLEFKDIPLPFDGVFVVRFVSGHALVLNWSSWLAEEPGLRLVRPAGTTRRAAGELQVRLAFPDGSFTHMAARTDIARRGRLDWTPDGDVDETEWRNFRNALSVGIRAMPMGGLWNGVSLPSSVKAALSRTVVDGSAEVRREIFARGVLEAVQSCADGLPRWDQDDLGHRVFVSFPRWLAFRLCRLLASARVEDLFDDENDRRAFAFRLVPVRSLLRKGALAFVQPNNVVELMARIRGVRRYLYRRDTVLRIPPEFRQNHPSFRGRLCPIETPESELIGLALQLARGARVDEEGHVVPVPHSAAARGVASECLSWGTALIPCSQYNDGARNMLGAKNLRQAVPVKDRKSPAVKTGAEGALMDRMSRLVDLGICPDSRDGDGRFALGRDLLVAYLPWYGWNVDDAMVVNRDMVEAMGVSERKHVSRLVDPEWRLVSCAEAPCALKNGTEIASFADARGRIFRICYRDDTPARLVSSPVLPRTRHMGVSRRFSYDIEKIVPLGVGDKLMGRHGNKGVVGRLLESKEMPCLPDDPRLPESLRGRAVDILLNPHGVLSRMNPGQLLETHLGWLLHAGLNESDLLVDERGPCALGSVDNVFLDHNKIRTAFERTGLDCRGCVRLVMPDGSLTTDPVLVGYQHVVRLHHIPEFKAQARRGGQARYSRTTHQAVHGRKTGGGQRLGEMEVWALAAHDAPHILEEMLGAKSDADWAKKWNGGDVPPLGQVTAGFPSLLKDWLIALGMRMHVDGGRVRFSFYEPDELRKICGGEAARVVSKAGTRRVPMAMFACSAETCTWNIAGQFALDGKKGGSKLSVGALLRELGYEGSAPLRLAKDSKDVFDWPLRRVGAVDQVGCLRVELQGYEADKKGLTVLVSASERDAPSDWPKDFRFAAYGETECGQRSSREKANASTLLEWLVSENAPYALEAYAVRCPEHKSRILKGSTNGSTLLCEKGSVFDEGIFGPWSKQFAPQDKWGFVELPEEIDYPWEVFDAKFGKRWPDLREALPKLKLIPVLPMRYRHPFRDVCSDLDGHVLEEDGLSEQDRDDLNRLYQALVFACESGKDVREAVVALFAKLAARLDSKDGLLRHEGLGRRVDWSFRLVITPNPELDWNQAGVPCRVLWELFGDEVEAWYREHEQIENGGVHDGMEENHEFCEGWSWPKSSRVRDVGQIYEMLVRYLAADENRNRLILLNRQPTLHRDGFQAFHPVPLRPEEGEVLQISPLCCKGFAADFDGDEMVGHYPVSVAAQNEACRLLPDNNLLSVGTGDPAANYDRDFVSGLQLLHEDPEGSRHEFEEIGLAPCCLRLLDEVCEPGEFGMKLLTHLCTAESHRDEAVRKISALARLAFRACTRRGLSFGYYSLLDACPQIGQEPGAAKITLQRILRERTTVDDRGLLSVARMVVSGANGASQIHQVVGARGRLDPGRLGYESESRAEYAELESSLVLGMNWTEFFWSSWNARNTMIDKKLGAGVAGDLTRRLVFRMWPRGREALVSAQAFGERGLQVAMQGFHTGARGIDIWKSRSLFLDGVVETVDGRKDFVGEGDKDGFFRAIRQDGTAKSKYADLKPEHLEELWRMLCEARNGDSPVETGLTGLFFQRQCPRILLLAAQKTDLLLASSPFAGVAFNLCGARDVFESECDVGEDNGI